MIQGIFRVIQGIVRLRGATDNSLIGNVSDSLKANITNPVDFGTSTTAIRVAAQIGNATGSAAFGAGATNAQTQRVVFPTDMPAIPVVIDFDQFVSLGQAFVVSSNTILIAGSSETPFLLIKNPSGSGKNLRIRAIQVAGLISGTQTGVIRAYKDPTITDNGTTVTVNDMKIGPSPSTSVATAFTLPTISANGIYLSSLILTAGSSSLENSFFNFVVEPNNNLLFTVTPSNNNNIWSIETQWIEA